MVIKQLSVFIENREGRLEQVTQILKDNDINISALSLADTSEYGMLRMIVSDAQKGKGVLKAAGFSTNLTDVVAVKIPHKVGALHDLLQSLKGVNIEYMYALANNGDSAMILKISNNEAALNALKKAGFEILQQ